METTLIVLTAALAMLAVERLAPGRQWESTAAWWPRAIALNVVQAAAVFIAAATWDAWLPGLTLWSLEGIAGPVGAVAAGYIAITFVFYWWHRARHASPFLWRWLHQVHHSPQRLEIATSFYKHPVEIFTNSLICSVVLHVVCGLSPANAAVVTAITGLAELFYHWNVRTPSWLGFIIQRPESHCFHHERDVHTRNFSDLPLWDMLFGTFHNEPRFAGRCGFAGRQELRLGEMLVGIDIEQAARPGEARHRWAAAGLLLIGLTQLAFDLLDVPAGKAIGAALAASPAPKVFTAHQGFETYSSVFVISWSDREGERRELQLTPQTYAGVEGPYNRRNAYGAALSYAPILQSHPATRPMHDAAMRYAICRSSILEELGIDRGGVAGPIRVVLQPRQTLEPGKWKLDYEVDCHA